MTTLKYKKIVDMYKAIEKLGDTTISMAKSTENVKKFIHNKKLINEAYEIVELKSKPAPGYTQYVKAAEAIKRGSNSEEEYTKLNLKHGEDLDVEFMRRVAFDDFLRETIDLDLEYLDMSCIDHSGSAKDIEFLCNIDIMLSV